MSDFDSIAGIYDVLVRLVFGRTLTRMRVAHFRSILPGSKVLIVGGGTGACLEALPDVATIHYVEKSRRMLSKAKLRKSKVPVHFICEDFVEWEVPQSFDTILTPFFLDVFDAERLELVIQKLKEGLKDGGRLIVTDFKDTRKWPHQLLLWVMHRFFKFSVKLESSRLQDLHCILESEGFIAVDRKWSPKGFIFSGVYVPTK